MTDYIKTVEDLMMCNGRTVSLDTETTGLNPWQDKLIGVSFYTEIDEVPHWGYIPTLDSETRSTVKAAVASLDPDTIMIYHNAKFDMHFLKLNPKKGKWRIMDTTIMVHLLDSRNKKALKIAEQMFLGTDSKRDHVDAAPARTKIWDWPLSIVSAYGANDAKVTYQLAKKLYPIMEEEGLLDLFWKDTDKYLKTLFAIEETGVLLDENKCIWSSERLQDHVEALEVELFDKCGNTFNWRSPQQLSRAIYDGLGISKPKNPFADADGIDRSRFADSGKYKSTCTSTFLLTEKVHHPLGELISSLRECAKLKKSYMKWMELQDDNHLLHTTFNQTGTRTGRLSSSRPNLQNIPSNVRGRFTQSVYTGSLTRADEFNMRKAVIARPGHVFVSVDYKQMEMRMFGILSKDPFMLDALIAGKDVHLEIALKVWGDCGEVTNKVHREWSKTITFGLIYGMTLGSLQYKLNMNRMEAATVTDQYWGQFPRIKPWMSEIVQMCKQDLYLRYWSGRIWREDNPIDMYKGCNALIQGGCADLLSIAAGRVDEFLDEVEDSRLVNLVHDETISEVPEEHLLDYSREISTRMQVPDLFGIPFSTDVKIGSSYGDMEKLPKGMISDSSISGITFKEIQRLANYHPSEVVEDTTDLDEDSEEDEEEDEEVEA